MNHYRVEINGMPYVPGMVRGRLQHGMTQAREQGIVILSQHEIRSFSSLPLGFIVVEGAPFSHALVHLLGMGVPTVIVNEKQVGMLVDGQEVVLDGSRGRISSELDTISELDQLMPAMATDKPFTTLDGVEVHLLAGVRNSDAARQARLAGASAIGLVRSEFFLPPQGQLPDTAYYEQVFGELCEVATPLDVTIRLLDLAVDKLPDWLPDFVVQSSVLGYQGVRMYGTEPVSEVIQAQLAAINKLSEKFSLSLLLPYMVRLEELQYWVRRIRPSLSESVTIGSMVETPASLLDVNNWFSHADFVAVGCNDLMQCLFAADRNCAGLRDYLDPYAPMLYRLFRQVADNAGEYLSHVRLCGVLSQLPGILPILLGLGYRSFSVEASLIPHLAQSAALIDIPSAQVLANEVCMATESQQVLDIMGLELDYHCSFLTPGK